MHTYKHPWFQYGLRTLLLLAILENLGLCWLGTGMYRAGTQREARETLKSLRWGVLYEYRHDSDFDFVSGQPPGSAWLRKLLGVDFFADVTWVNTPYREYGVPQDADFDYLACFPRLRRLDLGSDATDSVLGRLRGMRRLEWLQMRGGKITDSGLQNLEQLTRLRVLVLSQTQISDPGLDYLRALSQLRSLDLADTKISDAGVGRLTELRELKDLSLSGTRITDAGLEYLEGLTQLMGLSLYGTQVTDKGVRKLQRALPNCLISK